MWVIRLFEISRNLLIDYTLHQMIIMIQYLYGVKAYLVFMYLENGILQKVAGVCRQQLCYAPTVFSGLLIVTGDIAVRTCI